VAQFDIAAGLPVVLPWRIERGVNRSVESLGMQLLKISRRRLIAAGLGALGVTAGGYSCCFEPTWLVTRHIRLSATKPAHRFVHFTDLHHKGDRRYLQRVVSIINDLNPEFVCFTGDILEDAEFLPEALELMRGIRAPLYGIPGNHDYWAKIDFKVTADAFAATGGKWLMDESVLTHDRQINIIGVTCNKPPTVQPLPGVRNILLFHYPAWVQKLSGVRFDVMLAGHSHGGQVRLPFFGPLLVPFGVTDFDLGLYRTPSGPLYVNPGIGCFYANVRFCCRPELALIEI
jgi:uncharacterized protein